MIGKNFRLGIPGEKTQGVKNFDNGGGGRFLEILSCPPICVALQMPPPQILKPGATTVHT